jgi:hypothetical protein
LKEKAMTKRNDLRIDVAALQKGQPLDDHSVNGLGPEFADMLQSEDLGTDEETLEAVPVDDEDDQVDRTSTTGANLDDNGDSYQEGVDRVIGRGDTAPIYTDGLMNTLSRGARR